MLQPSKISPNEKPVEPFPEELANRCGSRSAVYEFLSRIYLEEISPEFLQALRDPGVLKIFRDLGINFADDLGDGDDAVLLEELATTFCATFLISDVVALYPYESCQREESLQGKSSWLVECFYRQCGLGLPEEARELPDHLGLEFDFMGKLAGKESRCRERGQKTDAERYRRQQKQFLDNHLLIWVPRYGRTVERLAEHPFYRSIGKLTFDYMTMESWEFA